MAGWIASALRPCATQLIVCDPQHNPLISHGNKDDYTGAADLCRLLRLGELVEVFHRNQEHRADFKIMVQQYLRFTRDRAVEVSNQVQITTGWSGANGRNPGVHEEASCFVSESTANECSAIHDGESVRAVGRNGYAPEKARSYMAELGKRYPEIVQFQRAPGIGVVSSHVFGAFIQTPHRYSNKRKFWRYCGLGIRQRSSAGKPLAYPRLDRSGTEA